MPADDGEGNDRLIKRLYSSVMIVQMSQNPFFRNDTIVVLFCKAVCKSCEISTCWDIYSWWTARVTLQLIPPDWHTSSNVRHQCSNFIQCWWGLQNETVCSANIGFSTLTGTHLVLLLFLQQSFTCSWPVVLSLFPAPPLSSPYRALHFLLLGWMFTVEEKCCHPVDKRDTAGTQEKSNKTENFGNESVTMYTKNTLFNSYIATNAYNTYWYLLFVSNFKLATWWKWS